MTHVDYLSISFDAATMKAPLAFKRQTSLVRFLRLHLPPSLHKLTEPQIAHMRQFPNGVAYSNGVTFFWGSHANYLIQISGRGLNLMNEAFETLTYVSDIQSHKRFARFTRIDFARDFPHQTVSELMEKHPYNPRIKTLNSWVTQSGHTEYIGSRSSDKFTRVYEYYEPHPRANSTRVEFQINKKQANAMANAYLAHGARVVFDNISTNVFTVQLGDGGNIKLSTYNEKSKANTLRWLHKQVAPAIKRLLAENEVTKIELLELFGMFDNYND